MEEESERAEKLTMTEFGRKDGDESERLLDLAAGGVIDGDSADDWDCSDLVSGI